MQKCLLMLKCSADCTSLQTARCRKGFGKKDQRWSHWQLTLSSVSCCLNSSSSSESQSGNWYIFIPYCSISSRIYRETDNRESTEWKHRFGHSNVSWVKDEFICIPRNKWVLLMFIERDQPCLDFLFLDLTWGECVCFSQDGHNVNLFMQSFHKLHIQRPEAWREKYIHIKYKETQYHQSVSTPGKLIDVDGI